MVNLGNAWHIPTNPQPRERGGMRDPVGALVPGMAFTIFSGNQDEGPGGNPGNQLQVGSSVFFKRTIDAAWTEAPMQFWSAADNDKFYAATLAANTFAAGDVVQYYVRIPYSDHDTTFLLANGPVSATTADETAARGAPFTFTVESAAVRGQWGPVFPLPNVAVHASLLPTGQVLIWGRRDQPSQSLDEHFCTPFLWDPETDQVTNTAQPTLADGNTTVNLFCSGHTFLPDGRLMVVGGHLFDSQGLNQACIYDPVANSWIPTAVKDTDHGRWYPTATTLADGSVLVTSGSFLQDGQTPINAIPQVWNDGAWTSHPEFALPPEKASFPLYPRMHVTSSGKVFMTGALAASWTLDLTGAGQWTSSQGRHQGLREYAPSVMYDVDKFIFIGGGNGPNGLAPTAEAETIELQTTPPTWQRAGPMQFARRQHNATILADGTVLVTGGTRGGGGLGGKGFNDLTPGQPVHTAELWDPVSGQWTELAAEQVDRCYHSTAVLLPDGSVLSAGGGEYRPADGPAPNDPLDSHRDGQIFSPPYLFKGPRPHITNAPVTVDHGTTFQVDTEQAADIAKVTMIRLSSVTHSFNMNPRINVLAFEPSAGGLAVTAPATPNVCPPGHYLLFLISKLGVPSVAKVIQVQWAAGGTTAAAAEIASLVAAAPAEAAPPPDAFALQANVLANAAGPAVVVGLLGSCPYGIGACWGGAHEGLTNLHGVQVVDPIPDAENSTARVFLTHEHLPALDQWELDFQQVVNRSYRLRGIEMSLTGTLSAEGGGLVLDGAGQRPPVQLVAMVAADKIQWDHVNGAPKPLDPQEAGAFTNLYTQVANLAQGTAVTVTGPLMETAAGYQLEVRLFTT
jgi:galactose oxidase